MAVELKPIKYISYRIYTVTKIKEKYGFRIILELNDGTTRPVQHAGFEKKEGAEKEKCRIIGLLEKQEYVVYSHILVQTYMEYWYEYLLPKRLNSEGSFGAYRNCVFNHIIPAIGKLKVIELKRGHIKKLYKQVYDKSPSVARLLQSVLCSALTDAVTEKFIPSNVALGIELIPKLKTKDIESLEKKPEYHTMKIDEKKTYTIPQVITLLKASKESKIYLHILFAVLMGLRKSEINGIKYSDIDFLHRKLYLKVQLRKKSRSKKGRLCTKNFNKTRNTIKNSFK